MIGIPGIYCMRKQKIVVLELIQDVRIFVDVNENKNVEFPF